MTKAMPRWQYHCWRALNFTLGVEALALFVALVTCPPGASGGRLIVALLSILCAIGVGVSAGFVEAGRQSAGSAS